MRAVTKLLTAAGLALFAATASAQVISGESVYEDNFAHTPPPEPAQQESKSRADGERASTPAKDEKRRD